MYKHLLISTDGSDVAQKGVTYGLELAKATGARATILMVAETILPFATPDGSSALMYQEYADAQQQLANGVLAEVQKDASQLGVTVDTICMESIPPAEAIVETAKSRGCDLITMSSHGRRGLRRMMLGSVASEVLAASPIPVLVVK